MPVTDQNVGFKGTKTSHDAAVSMHPQLKGLKAEIISTMSAFAEPITPDEVADLMGRSLLSIRPRMSELKTSGAISPTGGTRTNESGREAHLFVLRDHSKGN